MYSYRKYVYRKKSKAKLYKVLDDGSFGNKRSEHSENIHFLYFRYFGKKSIW